MSRLPEPLVPAEVDLRGLEYMPLLGAKLFSSDFDLEASDLEFRVGLRLWWAAWNQVPAGSLPATDRALCRLAGFDDNVGKWRKVKARALHGFKPCSDGRLYHDVLAEQALIAWEKRAEDRARRDAEAERKRRERADRAAIFAQLREHGVVPKFNSKMEDLRALIQQHIAPSQGIRVRVGSEPVTPAVTRTVARTSRGRSRGQVPDSHADGHADSPRTVTAKTGRDGTGRLKPTAAADLGSTTDPPVENSRPPAPPPLASDESDGQGAHRLRLADVLRGQGIDLASGREALERMVADRADPDAVRRAIEALRAQGVPDIGPTLVERKLRGMASATGGVSADGAAFAGWHRDPGRAQAYAAHLGVAPARPGESQDAFVARIRKALAERNGQERVA